jgi:hypothetical protein
MGEVVPRCRESHQDRRSGEYDSRSHGRASWHVELASSL